MMITHGMSEHPLYGTWGNMMTRCYNPNFRQFKDWGGRGIIVCERWHDPRLFIEDIESSIGPRPPGLTLDRIGNEGSYEPGNVRWATRAEQIRNSRKYRDGTRRGALYQAWWRIMQQRPADVCERWHEWAAFAADIAREIGPRPAGSRFHRLDDSRLYEQGNVAWVTGAEQIRRAQEARWGASRPAPKHGMFGHPLYGTWRHILRENPGQVHGPWHDVRAFISEAAAELGPRPPGRAFRRIDPDGRYEPGNICWGPRGRPARQAH